MTLFILLLCLGIAFFVKREIGKVPTETQLQMYEKLSYFKDNCFQSPLSQTTDFNHIRNGGSLGVLRLLFPSQFGPKRPLPLEPLSRESFSETPANFAFYWFGHATVLMEIAGKRILFDPVFGNAAPVPFLIPRYADAPLSVKQLPAIDVVVITHNHYDHLERKSIQALKNNHFIVPCGLGVTLRDWGVEENHITELSWGDSYQVGEVSLTAETAVHFSGRGFGDRDKTACNAYVIRSPNKKIFWGGDTGYSSHFSDIAQKYGVFDLAILEIDGWNPAWPHTHLFPEQVVQAATDLGVTHLLPIHWGTYSLGFHPWHESIDMVFAAAADSPINILTPKIGMLTDLHTETTHWWQYVDEQ